MSTSPDPQNILFVKTLYIDDYIYVTNTIYKSALYRSKMFTDFF